MLTVFIEFVFIVCRSLGFFLLFPPGIQFVSYTQRVAFALIAGASFFSTVTPSEHLSWCWLTAISELLLGVCIGFPSVLIVRITALLGELVDIGRGAQLAQSYNPFNAGSSSPTASLLFTFAITCLLFMGLFPALIILLHESFLILPPGGGAEGIFALLSSKVLVLIPTVIHWSFVAFLPFCFVYLALDLLISLTTRVLSGGMFYAEAFMLKSFAAFVIIMISLLQGLHLSLFRICRQITEGLFEPGLFLSI